MTEDAELFLLGQVAANQIAATRNLLKAMIKENTAIKQELFILQQNKHESEENSISGYLRGLNSLTKL